MPVRLCLPLQDLLGGRAAQGSVDLIGVGQKPDIRIKVALGESATGGAVFALAACDGRR